MKYLLIASFALLLGACGTKPTPPDLAKLGTLYYSKPVQGVPATVVFVRDFSFAGAGTTFYLYIDGERAGELETSEKVSVELTAGEHNFGVDLSASTGQAASFLDERLEPGQSYVYRLSGDRNGVQIARSP